MFLTRNTLRLPRRAPAALNVQRPINISLSSYFPSDTRYFYGYPAGEDSGFLNRVPPSVEELVAARAFSCAGAHVSVVGFAATNAPLIEPELLAKFGIPQLDHNRLTLLPKEIDSSVQGARRNRLIKQALAAAVPANSLVMAQPFGGDEMARIYQIPAKLTRWLNDKSTMDQYISDSYLPTRLAMYDDGQAFADAYGGLELPFVVKASSSSAGDGVYICLDQADLTQAIKELRPIVGKILIERFISVRKNYGIHFGIPHNSQAPIDIFGVNEQLTTEKGEFIGGIINSTTIPKALAKTVEYLRDTVLPQIRSMGWYGVGGFDVLLDAHNRPYFIDCNFRMTGMSAYHFLVANHTIAAPLTGFSGSFVGSQFEFENSLLPIAGASAQQPGKIMQIIALSHHGKVWDFNAALFFDTPEQLRRRSAALLKLGVKSQALEQLQGSL